MKNKYYILKIKCFFIKKLIMGNSNKNSKSKYFSIYLDKPYYYNNDEVSGTIIINDIENIELIEASLKLDLIEKWFYVVGSGDNAVVHTLEHKTNKKYFPINIKKINNDNYINYKIPFNFKFFDLEPTFIFDKVNYVKTVLTFELLGNKFIKNGKKNKKPIREKYESFLTIKREPNYNNLYFSNVIEQDLKKFNLFPFSAYGNCIVSLKTEKTHFDVEEEIPFEIDIENNLNLIEISNIIFYILQIKKNKKLNKTIDSTYKFKYNIKNDKIKISPGQKGCFKYITKIDNNINKNNFNITTIGNIITNNYFINVELEFEKLRKKHEIKLPIFIGINKQKIKPMEFEVIEKNNFSNNYCVNIDNLSNNNNIQINNEIIEKEIHNDSMIYGFENINYLNN